MSSYKLARYPRDKFRFRLFDNIFQYKTAAEVLAAHPGAVGCINLGYFALTDIPSAGVQYLDHQCAVMICGGWVRRLSGPGRGCASTQKAMLLWATKAMPSMTT